MGIIEIILPRNLLRENISDLKFAWHGYQIAELFKIEYRENLTCLMFQSYMFNEKIFNCTDNYDGTVKFTTTDEDLSK